MQRDYVRLRRCGPESLTTQPDCLGAVVRDVVSTVTTLTFVPGSNNDSVLYELFNSANALVGTTTTQSWEDGQRINGYNGGNVFAVDALGFQARNGVTGDNASSTT